MDAEDIENGVKIAGAMLTAGLGLVNLVKAYHKSKPALKVDVRADIELLKLIDSSDRNYDLVKRRIDATIARLYGDAERTPGILGNVYSYPTLLFGIALSLGLGYWTYYLYDAGKPWWSWVLTGFFTIGGVGNIMIAFDPSSVKNTKPASPARATAEGEGVPNVAASKV